MSEVKRNSAIAEALGGATGSVAVKIRNLASSSCTAPSASSYYVSASAPGSRRSSICQALEGWASARSSTSSTMHANGKVVFNLSSRLGTLKLKDTPETKDASSGSDSASGSPRVELYLAPAPWRGTSVSTPKAISDQEQVLARWAVESSLIDPSTTYYHKFLKSRIAALSAHTLPDVPVEDTLFFCQLQAFIFTLDDVLDNVEDFRVKDSTDNFLLQSLTQVFAVFKAIVRGEYDSEMKLDSDSDSCATQSANSIATRLASDKERANISSFPLFRPFLKVLLDIRFGAKQVGLDLSWWVECFEKYFDAMAFEHGSRACSVSENTKYNPRLWTYMMNREHTVSYLVSVASFLLLKKVSVPREFVSLHMVHLLLTNATYHVIAVNDIFSYEKELSLNEVDNLLMVDNGRMSLQDVIAHSNNMAKEIADLSQILLVNPGYAVKRAAAGLSNMENASAIIEAFVETVINSVNGHIYWYASSARYGCYRFI